MTDTRTNRPILSMSKTEYFYCLNLCRTSDFWCFRCCFVILYFVLFFFFCLVFCFVCLFVCLFFILFAAADASPTPPPGGGADLKHGACTEMWIPEDPFSRTEERLRKTRHRVSLSYFYSLKICFKFIRFCTLCLLACRTISEQFIFFFIFKVLSIHFQNSFILIFVIGL